MLASTFLSMETLPVTLPVDGSFPQSPAEYAMDDAWMPQADAFAAVPQASGLNAVTHGHDQATYAFIPNAFDQHVPSHTAHTAHTDQHPSGAQYANSTAMPHTSKRSHVVAAEPAGIRGLPSYNAYHIGAGSPAHTGASSGGESPRVGHGAPTGSAKDSKAVQWKHNQHTAYYKTYTESMVPCEDATIQCDVDKGFKASATEGYICQKKNHFQVSIRVAASDCPRVVDTGDGTMAKVEGLFVELYGIKCENPEARIALDQSSTDRQKRPFKPLALNGGPPGQAMQESIAIGRLHFHETTVH